MQHYWSLHAVTLENVWLTIGAFDGVHRGHQEVITQMTTAAHQAGATAAVLTFYPHPAVILGRRNDFRYLTTPEQRAALLGELGVDVVITHPFNKDVSQLTALEFMQLLKDRLGLAKLFAGYDFALGRNREGTVPRLRQIGQELGYTVHQIAPLETDGEPISSSRIRSALEAGDVATAAQMLARPYTLRGEVIHGDNRGRQIGIPTANLEVWSRQVVPKAGVYVCTARVGGQTWGAMTNIGVRPTFDNAGPIPRVEAHLLDFDDDLYGRELQLAFVERLRDEQRFPGIEALVAQIHDDIARGREILNQGVLGS